MNDADRILADLNKTFAQSEALQAAMRDNTEHRNQVYRHLRACFNKATREGDARIPSYLSAAILNVLSLITGPK